jgi:hypothetical protein
MAHVKRPAIVGLTGQIVEARFGTSMKHTALIAAAGQGIRRSVAPRLAPTGLAGTERVVDGGQLAVT